MFSDYFVLDREIELFRYNGMAAVVASPSASSFLGDGDAVTIASELVDVASKWELLATCLKLSSSDIANINTKYGGEVNLALIKVISRWIATNQQLTWSDLVQALREPILNEEWCATKIEKKFCVREPSPCKLLWLASTCSRLLHFVEFLHILCYLPLEIICTCAFSGYTTRSSP